MDNEQHINMKFCFKLQRSAREIYKMSKLVYGDAGVTMKTVYKWFESLFCLRRVQTCPVQAPTARGNKAHKPLGTGRAQAGAGNSEQRVL